MFLNLKVLQRLGNIYIDKNRYPLLYIIIYLTNDILYYQTKLSNQSIIIKTSTRHDSTIVICGETFAYYSIKPYNNTKGICIYFFYPNRKRRQ